MGLERVSAVAQSMDLLSALPTVITVAGTNGKGSCIATLEAIFLAADYHVAVYTSPHLLRYNERIRVQGQMVTDDALCEAFAAIEKARGLTTLTYFEFTTLAALWLFKKTSLDIIILEVGLGGRLDAVNIVDADIAIIATIALDHTDILGANREAIGYEKAGIMRENKPVICGDYDVPESIRHRASVLQAPLYCQNVDFGYLEEKESWTWWGNSRHLTHLPIPSLELQNVSTAFKALELLPYSFSQQTLIRALQQVHLLGRFQVISGEISRIFDVAHNPAGGQWLAHRLRQEPCQGRTLAIIGMLSDKDYRGTLEPLLPLIDSWYVTNLQVERALPAEVLMSELSLIGAKDVKSCSSVQTAYKQAIHAAKPKDRVLIFGSFHTVAEGMLC